MIEELLILVNQQDTPIGTMPKLLAHQRGCLHRAFSIFIFNHKNELLIQQRALHTVLQDNGRIPAVVIQDHKKRPTMRRCVA